MFHIKICGITTVADAEAALEAGADAVGLNFFPGSPRHVDLATARSISRAIGSRATKVGVFVNSSAADVLRAADEAGLDVVQLHGDEPPALLRALAGRKVMRAFRGVDPSSIADYLRACNELDCRPAMVMIDGASSSQYGGTGEQADWTALAAMRSSFDCPLVLAGGLRPDNVGRAIAAVRPSAVDTASGVEEAPARKSADLMRRFVAAAREAFASL